MKKMLSIPLSLWRRSHSSMEHPAELLVHSYLDACRHGSKSMSEKNIKSVVKHVEEAVRKQFNSEKTGKDFRLRASNIGKAACQLWFQKNNPEAAISHRHIF